MAKLSHKVSNSTANTNSTKLGTTLSTKVSTSKTSASTHSQVEKSIERSKLIGTPISINKIIDEIGIGNFGTLDKATANRLFSEDAPIVPEQVKKIIIETVLRPEIAVAVEQYASKLNKKYDELQNKLEQANQTITKQEKQIGNMKIQIDEAEEETYKIKKEYSDTVPVSDLISNFLSGNHTNEYTDKISSLLKETYKNGKRNGVKFTYNFLKGFVIIQETIKNLGSEEKENLDLLFASGKTLLSNISELYVSERRPILDITANFLNSFLHTYSFVSPEQTLQIDPQLHNAEGLGGNNVKEGISFAVVRRETRKTVYYADIYTN